MTKRYSGSLFVVLGLAASLWACGSNSSYNASNDAGLGGGIGTGGTKATGGTTASTGDTAAATGGTTASAGGTTASAGGTAAATGGTTAATGGATSTDAGSSNCPIIYDWEGTTGTATDLQGWSADTGVTLSVSSTEANSGSQSLQVSLPQMSSTAADGGVSTATYSIYVTPPASANLWAGAVVTFNVWAPSTATNLTFKAFTQNTSAWTWDDTGNSSITVVLGGWTTWTYTVPNVPLLPGGMQRLGIQFLVSGSASFSGGDVFVDAITACPGTGSCTGSGTGSYSWETAGSVDGWTIVGNPCTPDTTIDQMSMTTPAAEAGTGALSMTFASLPAASSSISCASRQLVLDNPNVYCGKTITYYVWMPTGATAAGVIVQPFSRQDGWVWSMGSNVALTEGAWTTITYQMPASISYLGVQQIGLQFSNTSTAAAFSGTAYVDNVTWP